jgi:hypothetical protein
MGQRSYCARLEVTFQPGAFLSTFVTLIINLRDNRKNA